jgi:hypothetical protein
MQRTEKKKAVFHPLFLYGGPFDHENAPFLTNRVPRTFHHLTKLFYMTKACFPIGFNELISSGEIYQRAISGRPSFLRSL